MLKNKEIKNFFDSIDLFKDFTYEEIYNKLIYDNRLVNDNNDMLISIMEQLCQCNKKIEDNFILIEEGIEYTVDSRLMEIGFRVSFDNCINVLCELISFLKKKKIKYCIKIAIKNNICYVIMNIIDKDYLLKTTDYINDKLGKKLECVSPYIFSDDNVSLSFNLEYSYVEILSMYLYKYLNKNDGVIGYNGFKKFILDYYFKITNQVDMYQLLEFNKRDISLSKFFYNMDICTTLIIYLFNNKDLEDYCDYYKKIKKNEKKNIDLYSLFDNLNVNIDLFTKLVSTMYLKYGEEYAKNSILNYMNTGKKGYITRENDLRKEIVESKTFMVFLYRMDFDIEFNKIVNGFKLDNKKKILENICRETYLTCNDYEKCNSGKIHIARTLIRISCGDYSSITRRNDARKIAMENIEPSEVVSLIKDTLKIDYVKKEATLYELYAEYIENLCVV